MLTVLFPPHGCHTLTLCHCPVALLLFLFCCHGHKSRHCNLFGCFCFIITLELFAIVAAGWLVGCLLLLFILPLVDYFHFVDIMFHIFVLLLRSLSPFTRCCPQHDHHHCYYQRQLLRRRRILIFYLYTPGDVVATFCCCCFVVAG